MNPKFSIIIPVYNVAPYLRECLDSVLAQIFTDWEAICIDDGSTDRSGTILDEYAARDRRFHIYHQQNAGVSEARNLGLSQATGAWITYLDADDVMHKSFLSTLHHICETHSECDMAVAGILPFQDGMHIVWPKSTGKFDVFSCEGGLAVAAMNKASLIDGFSIRRNRLGHLRFPVRRLGEDRIYGVLCLLTASSVIVIADSLTAYRQHQDSASHCDWDYARLHEELEYRILSLKEKERLRALSRVECIYWVGSFILRIFPRRVNVLSKVDRDRLIDYWLDNSLFFASFIGFGRMVRVCLLLSGKTRSRLLFTLLFFWYPDFIARARKVLRLVFYPIVVLTRPIRHRRH